MHLACSGNGFLIYHLVNLPRVGRSCNRSALGGVHALLCYVLMLGMQVLYYFPSSLY
jgi:hypothetical protein